MPGPSRRWCVALFCAVAAGHPGAAPPGAAQGERPAAAARPDPPAGTAIRIDALVTDAAGRTVAGLGPADFQLLVNGTPRPLASVSSAPRSPATPPAPIVTPQDEAAAARVAGSRTFAVLLDEFHVSPGAGTRRVQDALTRFIDEDLRPHDLAVIVRPFEATGALRLTRDRAALRSAAAAFAGRQGDPSPRSPFEEQFIGRSPQAVSSARAQIVTAALRTLILRLGELQPDRGIVLLVSDGFPRGASGSPGGREGNLEGAVRSASRLNLTLYAMSPGGGMPAAPGAAAAEGAATLTWLAEQTGGRAVTGGSLADAFARLSRDLAASYALTYLPPETDGRFHAIEVRTPSRPLHIRARPGYWAPFGSARRTGSGLPARLRALRRSRFADAWVGLVPVPGGRARMVVTWEPSADGPSRAVSVTVRARTSGGTELFTGPIAPVRHGRAAADSARFAVPPGRVELDLDVADASGRVLDTESRDVEVPDLSARRAGPLLLNPQVVRARTFRDFEAAAGDPDAAPSPTRVFARGDRLLIRVPAYDASGAPVGVSARLLNAWGHPMRDIDSVPLPGGVAQFGLPLAWLGPGQYLIELAGTGEGGTVKDRISFRLIG